MAPLAGFVFGAVFVVAVLYSSGVVSKHGKEWLSERQLTSVEETPLPTPPPAQLRGAEANPIVGSNASGAPCGLVEESTDYSGGDLKAQYDLHSFVACRSACAQEPACKSFTYVVALGACYLKDRVRPNATTSDCCVSGLPPCTHAPQVLPSAHRYNGQPMRGVAYGPLPCKDRCWVSEDMLQEGYQQLWGPTPGRNDLGVIKEIGGNSVRLYHSIGLDGPGNHGLFLDYAETLELDVMPGYHTYNAIYGDCPEFDCYEAWRSYTLKAFEQGFKRGNGWHPAVSVLLLFNELDFFRAHGRTAHLRSALSALDGVLAAEKNASVAPGRVKLSIAWSNAPGESLDGLVSGFAIWAFQDIVAGVANPSMVDYEPRTPLGEMQEAFRTRWAHSINVQTPGIVGYMAEHYHRFEPTPWFIGEYGANGMPQDQIEAELSAMDNTARSVSSPFMGMAFFQFQTAYFKGGSEMNFGLFRLGNRQIAETGEVCDKGISCKKWPVYCLTTDVGSLPAFVGGRADAVASVWGGAVNSTHMC